MDHTPDWTAFFAEIKSSVIALGATETNLETTEEHRRSNATFVMNGVTPGQVGDLIRNRLRAIRLTPRPSTSCTGRSVEILSRSDQTPFHFMCWSAGDKMVLTMNTHRRPKGWENRSGF